MQENSRRRQKYFFDMLVLVIVSGLVIFPALGQERHLASREVRHAEIIREMAEHGDYLVPRLLGEIYYDKPPVMHAPAAFLTRMVGKPSMTIARIPSAIAGMLGVLATYGIGLLLLDRRSALVGAIALLGIPGYSLMTREARPDMILCASMLFSCLCLGLGMKEEKCISRICWFVLAGLLTGLGVVTKGHYGVVVPAFFAIFAPFRRHDLKRPHWGWIGFGLGLLTAIAIWAIPAYLHDGGKYLLGVLFQPDLDVSKGGIRVKPFFYMWYGILLTLPLSFFLPLAIKDLRKCGYSAPLAIAGAIFIVISCIPKKRPHYMVPLYPFLALGITVSIIRYRITGHMLRRAAWVLISISVVAMPIYFVAIQPIVKPHKNTHMFFAKEVFRVIEPNSRVYCVTGINELLAWVGQRYKGIRKLDLNDPAIVTTLYEAKPGSYLVISDQNLTTLLKGKKPIQGELILDCNVGHERVMLFCLKRKTSEVR